MPDPVLVLSAHAVAGLGSATFGELKPMVQEFAEVPQLRAVCTQILEDLPAMEARATEAYGNADGVKLSVVLQWHDYPEASTKERSNAEESQRRVTRALSALRPQLVTWEGLPLDDITEDAVIAYTVEEARKQGIPAMPSDIKRGLRNGPYDAMSDFILRPRGRAGVGGENNALNLLHNLVLQHMAGGTVGESVYRFADLLSRARSETALINALYGLKQRGLTNGTVVIGYYHYESLAELCKRAGVATEFYDVHL